MSETSLADRFLHLVLLIPVLIPALVVHEYAHAWVAWKRGDSTAKDAGRLTLDPVAHFDPLGALMILVMFLSKMPFLFGWAKPVPVHYGNLRNPLRDMVLVAAAGPASNFLQAVVWCFILKGVHVIFGPANIIGEVGAVLAEIGIGLNLMLMAFNLLPIPPLDGSRIAVGLLPHSIATVIAQAEPFGFMLLMLFLFTGMFGIIASPVHLLIQQMIQWAS